MQMSCHFVDIGVGSDLFAVVGESFFGDVDHRFSSLPRTMWTLFELLTCDDWFYMSMALEFKRKSSIDNLIFKFLPRDAMLGAVLAVIVCLSVCHKSELYKGG